jgi:hypothetical protein
MRRRKLLVALAGPAVVVAVGAVVLWPAPTLVRVTKEHVDLICVSDSDDDEDAMTRAGVEAILGPPGDYTTRPTTIGSFSDVVDFRGGAPIFDILAYEPKG